MLHQHLFKKEEYIVALFLSNCDKDKEACDNILEELEKVQLKNVFRWNKIGITELVENQ